MGCQGVWGLDWGGPQQPLEYNPEQAASPPGLSSASIAWRHRLNALKHMLAICNCSY